ncbi:small multi-drug export protein [Vreelandella boliviensis]|uniref:small multi-drug export protein n=1 Tax=Vreelandella boliviensis TaxID=223527 RepID=UPI001B8BA27C|nr:small multi-drug export protein [Halomonas boliviensis]MBS3669994.1 small multi-drug export protein [Halomonas boliviensis]
MSEFMIYLSVFVGAATPALEVWIAVPLGVLAGLPWLPAALVGFLGNFITLLPVIYAGDKIKKWINSWKKPSLRTVNDNSNAKASRKQTILARFGVPGLAFLGPFLIGVHAASAFAIASGANRRSVIIWFSVSIFLCSIAFALLADLGLANFDGRSLPFNTA